MVKRLYSRCLIMVLIPFLALIQDKLHLKRNSKMDGITKIIITIGNKKATAILYDNPTSQDFIEKFPLTLEMEDYSRTEKICLLDKKLTSEKAPKGFDPAVGDITYYEPWGNIALFYKDFGFANGLISLGKITSGMELFETKGNIIATFDIDNH